MSKDTFVHPTAHIETGAELDHGVHVGPYCLIGPNVRLGRNVRVDGHASVQGHTQVGAGTHIFSYASVGVIPQDLKYQGEEARLEIGEDNRVREYVNISIGTEGGGMLTSIGSRNLIMVYTHVAHDCHIGNECIIANGVQLAGHVTVGDHAVIGGLAAVHQFCQVGKLAMIAGCAAVAQDVAPFCMVQGDRAKINGLNLVGLRRAKKDRKTLEAIKDMYRILFRETLPLDSAIERIERDVFDCPERSEFVAFLKTSERGVCRSTTKD